mmetsp:Transcript_43928/g.70448  ORF Transcript_43928/g.70448 Transcript_43928/m.70448 type:complete len:89 (-) Transcript_43928:84-350(-)
MFKLATEPYTSAKEPYASAKEPYTIANEPYTSAKEPYVILKADNISHMTVLRSVLCSSSSARFNFNTVWNSVAIRIGIHILHPPSSCF